MRIEERGNTLTVRATPGCMWIFGLWFVAGGVLAMAMTFLASNAHELEWWERLLAFAIGAACAAAGSFVILGMPAIHASSTARAAAQLSRRRGCAPAGASSSPVVTSP